MQRALLALLLVLAAGGLPVEAGYFWTEGSDCLTTESSLRLIKDEDAAGDSCGPVTLPTYRASGTFTFGTVGDCTPPMPAGVLIDDILILVAESENEPISLSFAIFFAEVPNSPQSAGTAGVDPANRIAVYWKRVITDGGGLSPSVADSGNHTTCQLHAFAGVRTTGDPWDVTAGGNDGGANDTSAVIPGATTTLDGVLVALIQGSSFDGTSTAECGAATNTELVNLTERTDNTNTAGLGGGHCLITGENATSGVYGSTTLTLANTSYKGAISIALVASQPITCPKTLASMGVGC